MHKYMYKKYIFFIQKIRNVQIDDKDVKLQIVSTYSTYM